MLTLISGCHSGLHLYCVISLEGLKGAVLEIVTWRSEAPGVALV
jgi:hypothetical protein